MDSSELPVEFEFQIGSEDHAARERVVQAEFQRAVMTETRRAIVVALAFAAGSLVAAGIFAALDYLHGARFVLVIVAIVVPLWTLKLRHMLAQRWYRAELRDPNWRNGRFKLYADRDRIAIAGERFESRMQWSAFSQIVEKDQRVYLFMSAGYAMMVCAPGAEQREAFAKFIALARERIASVEKHG